MRVSRSPKTRRRKQDANRQSFPDMFNYNGNGATAARSKSRQQANVKLPDLSHSSVHPSSSLANMASRVPRDRSEPDYSAYLSHSGSVPKLSTNYASHLSELGRQTRENAAQINRMLRQFSALHSLEQRVAAVENLSEETSRKFSNSERANEHVTDMLGQRIAAVEKAMREDQRRFAGELDEHTQNMTNQLKSLAQRVDQESGQRRHFESSVKDAVQVVQTECREIVALVQKQSLKNSGYLEELLREEVTARVKSEQAARAMLQQALNKTRQALRTVGDKHAALTDQVRARFDTLARELSANTTHEENLTVAVNQLRSEMGQQTEMVQSTGSALRRLATHQARLQDSMHALNAHLQKQLSNPDRAAHLLVMDAAASAPVNTGVDVGPDLSVKVAQLETQLKNLQAVEQRMLEAIMAKQAGHYVKITPPTPSPVPSPTASVDADSAATKIQKVYRGSRVRRQVKQQREEAHAAATKIQKVYRGSRVRKEVKSATQTNDDSDSGSKEQASTAADALPQAGQEDQHKAATKIQKVFRGSRTRKKLKTQAAAGTDTEEEEKAKGKKKESDDEEDVHAAATKIQKVYRGSRTRKHVKEKAATEAHAATKIQKVYRGSRTRKQVKEKQKTEAHAATKIQKVFRGSRTRKKLKKERPAQKPARTGPATATSTDKEHQAATKIQKVYRGSRTRKKLKDPQSSSSQAKGKPKAAPKTNPPAKSKPNTNPKPKAGTKAKPGVTGRKTGKPNAKKKKPRPKAKETSPRTRCNDIGDSEPGDLVLMQLDPLKTSVVDDLRGQVVQVTCGSTHAMAITRGGVVFSWGGNSDYQCGLGHQDEVSKPTPIDFTGALKAAGANARELRDLLTPPLRMSSVACGVTHSAAVSDMGLLFSWGSGMMGKLGHGNDTDQPYPSVVQVLAHGQRVLSACCGQYNTACVTMNPKSKRQAAFVWGAGDSGQIGNGTNAPQMQPVQVKFPGDAEPRALGLGNRHVVAVTSKGSVYSWGDGEFGQLGFGSEDDDNVHQLTPKLVPMDAHVVGVACGERHTSVLTKKGQVWSWGSGETHQIGIMDNVDQFHPVEVKGLPPCQSLDVGGVLTTAVTTAGDLYAWGFAYETAVPKRVDDTREYVLQRAAVGSVSNIALLTGAADEVYHWGLTADEEDEKAQPHQPSQLVEALRGKRFRAMACGSDFNVAVTVAGGVLTWGNNAQGQLGLKVEDDDGSADYVDSPRPVVFTPPPQWGGSFTVQRVACGVDHVVALSDVNASGHAAVFTWGSGDLGKLGHGSDKDCATPSLVEALKDKEVVSVAAGPFNSGVVTQDGAAFVWGSGGSGQLGGGQPVPMQNAPKLVMALKQKEVHVTSLAFGRQHTLFASSSGQAFSCGSNDYGQLGRAAETDEDGYLPVEAPAVVGGQSVQVTKVVCGEYISYFIANDGRLLSCGSGETFQLGHGTADDVTSPTPISALSSVKVVGVAVGEMATAAITAGGQLYIWGFSVPGARWSPDQPANDKSQDNTMAVPQLVAFANPKGANVSAVACARNHLLYSCRTNTLASKSD